MFVGMHFFTPVVLAGSVDLVRTIAGRPRWFSGKALFCIGICGILPDLADPHIRLSARMSSWSHTVWFAASLLPVFLAWILFHRNIQAIFTAVFCWTAVWLHLFCDGISGGIAPFYPLNAKHVGAYYFPPSQWLTADILITILTVILMTAVIGASRLQTKKAEALREKMLFESIESTDG